VALVTIKVTAKMENGRQVIRVEDEAVDLGDLPGALRRFVKATRKTEALLDADGDIDWATIIGIQNAAKAAKIQHFHYLTQPSEVTKAK
jgi:biopolymer transport protein ExbD